MSLTATEEAFLSREPFSISPEEKSQLHEIMAKLPSDHPLCVNASIMDTAIFDKNMLMPHVEKANRWSAAATVSEKHGAPSARLWDLAGLNYRMDSDHGRAGACWMRSGNSAITEEAEDSIIIQLFRASQTSYSSIGEDDLARSAHIKEFDYRTKISSFPKSLLIRAYKVTSLYGESPLRVAISAISLILLCSLIYWIGGLNDGEQTIHSWPTSLYFNFVTFTTLGYGDFSPSPGISRVFATFEAVSGLVLVSLFLVTFVRRYSR
ncbi:MAG: two pore domain potassium channel family protein [Gammaproteobacteria bacterium]|nr:two pore domain potassium channel family protein [Gammaproteobacteria bacterium]